VAETLPAELAAKSSHQHKSSSLLAPNHQAALCVSADLSAALHLFTADHNRCNQIVATVALDLIMLSGYQSKPSTVQRHEVKHAEPRWESAESAGNAAYAKTIFNFEDLGDGATYNQDQARRCVAACCGLSK